MEHEARKQDTIELVGGRRLGGLRKGRSTLAIWADQRDHTKPFNLWSAALLTRMLAQQCDLAPGDLVWMGGDTHLYLNHTHLIEEQLARTPQGHPRLEILRRPPSIFDYRIEDFAVEGYTPHPPIQAPVAV